MASDIRLGDNSVYCQVKDSITVSSDTPGSYLPANTRWSLLSISSSDIVIQDFINVTGPQNIPQQPPILIGIYTMKMMVGQIQELYKTIDDLKKKIAELEKTK